jgi:hypothetical protein
MIAYHTMHSPTFDMVTLNTGIVENIRLYGNYTPEFYTKEDVEKNLLFAEGSRKYVFLVLP